MQFDQIDRRVFTTLLGGAAAWPLAARAQQAADKMRRVGMLLPASSDNRDYQTWAGVFLQGLGQLGWNIGRNVQIDTRWATAHADNIRRHATELAGLAPDVILTFGTSTLGPLLQATRTVPVVFLFVNDPVAAGFVDSLARPGGNATGLLTSEYSIAGKWLELLKQIAPNVTRVAVFRDATLFSGPAQFGIIQAVAPSLKVEVSPINMRDADEVERAVAAFARSPTGGLIITPNPLATVHRDLIIALAARHRLRINTIAEGVESHAELELLRSMGCEEYSGHLLAEPGTSGEFERRWLRPGNVRALRRR